MPKQRLELQHLINRRSKLWHRHSLKLKQEDSEAESKAEAAAAESEHLREEVGRARGSSRRARPLAQPV